MAITSVVYFVGADAGVELAARGRRSPLVGLFLIFDLPFFGANLLKFFERRLVPDRRSRVVIFLVMTTWKKGPRPSRQEHRRQAPSHRRVPRRRRAS